MNFILSKRISLLFPGIIPFSAKFTCQDYSKWRMMRHSCWILSRFEIICGFKNENKADNVAFNAIRCYIAKES